MVLGVQNFLIFLISVSFEIRDYFENFDDDFDSDDSFDFVFYHSGPDLTFDVQLD